MRNLFFVCMVLLGLGCDEHAMNRREIKVKGCIVDSITNQPIPNAKVTVLCWYHAGWDKTDYLSIDTIADKNGCFNALFSKGYKVVIASVSPNCFPAINEVDDLENNNVEMNLKLIKVSSGNWLNVDLENYIIENSSN